MRCLLRLGLLASGCAAYNGYSVGTDPSTYQEAAAYCASVGGALAAIYSDADNEAARDACGLRKPADRLASGRAAATIPRTPSTRRGSGRTTRRPPRTRTGRPASRTTCAWNGAAYAGGAP